MIVVLMLGLWFIGSAGAQCVDYNNSPHWVGGLEQLGLELPGTLSDIAVSANHVYITGETDGFLVIDITDPQDPILVGTVGTRGRAENVAISGNYAYVAETHPWSGLQVIDISDPMSPRVVQSIGTQATRVTISGNYAYVGGYGVLTVFDITNPRALQAVGSVYTSFDGLPTSNIAISGAYAYFTDGALRESPTRIVSHSYVIDISNPMSPRVVGEMDRAILAVSGDFAYGLGSGQFQVIDVSNPTAPQIVGSVDTPGARRLVVTDKHAYVVGFGLQVIDISFPTNPRITGSADAPHAWGIAISGKHAYVVGPDFRVIDITKAEGTTLVSLGFGNDVIGCGLDVSGNHAYVIDFGRRAEPQGLWVIDISSPMQPMIAGGTWTSGRIADGFPWDVTISGNYAYISTSDYKESEDLPEYLGVIDISTPTSPRGIGLVKTPRSAIDIEISGGFAYLADRGADIQVVDVSIPSDPQIVGTVETSGEAYGIAIRDNLTYVADGTSGLLVFDMIDPLNPRLVGQVDTPGVALDVAISGSLALVADGSAGLHVVDIMNPNNLRILSSVTTLNAQHLAVSGSNAYVVDRYNDSYELSGLQVIDFSNPHDPRTLVRRYAQNPVRVAVSGEHVYVAGGYKGYVSFQVLPLQCEIVTPVALSDLTAFAVPGRVVLQWRASAPDLDRFEVQRGNGGGDFAPLAGTAVLIGPGAWEFEDASVDIGGTYYYRVLAHGRDGSAAVAGPVKVAVPGRRSMQVLAMPNPSASATVLQFDVGAPDSGAGVAALTVLDVAGRRVREVWRGRATRGNVVWDGRDDWGNRVGVGVYFVRLRARGATATTRVIMLPTR